MLKTGNYLGICEGIAWFGMNSVIWWESSVSFQYSSGNMEDYIALLPNKADKYYCKLLNCQILRQWQLRTRALYGLKNALGKCSTHFVISPRTRVFWRSLLLTYSDTFTFYLAQFKGLYIWMFPIYSFEWLHCEWGRIFLILDKYVYIYLLIYLLTVMSRL